VQQEMPKAILKLLVKPFSMMKMQALFRRISFPWLDIFKSELRMIINNETA